VYKLENNFEITQMKMQVEEVSEIKWFDFDDFVKLFYSDDFVPYDKEYKNMIVERLQSHFKRPQTPEESQISQN
jgi:isopentenyldiphosphate isomerase